MMFNGSVKKSRHHSQGTRRGGESKCGVAKRARGMERRAHRHRRGLVNEAFDKPHGEVVG